MSELNPLRHVRAAIPRLDIEANVNRSAGVHCLETVVIDPRLEGKLVAHMRDFHMAAEELKMCPVIVGGPLDGIPNAPISITFPGLSWELDVVILNV